MCSDNIARVKSFLLSRFYSASGNSFIFITLTALIHNYSLRGKPN